jgi:mRNA interferase RelE/StbE
VTSSYSLLLAGHRVKKDLDRLDRPVLERIWEAIRTLEQNPRPPAARKLRHPAIGEFRLRVGDWRVFYDVDEENRAVVVLRVMHRREAYRSR